MQHARIASRLAVIGITLLRVVGGFRDTVQGATLTTFVEVHKDGVGGVAGLNGALSVTVSPDGKHLYAAASVDSAVAVFSRSSTTGALTFVEVRKDGVGGVDGLGGASSVTVSPDGSHLYAAGSVDDAVAVFSRDSTTGALTFVEVQRDGVGGVDGLNGAKSVMASPDGSHLYAAGSVDDAVAVFSRDSTTGALTFVEVHKGGRGAVVGLIGAYSVTVSPDGKHMYAAGSADNTVAVFSRDSTTGALSFVEVQTNGMGGVDGLNGARSVTVSPDGKHLYAAGSADDAVAVFSRDSTTGTLTFVEVQKDGVGGVDGLNGASSVTVSPDGSHLYAAGGVDDAVAVFSVASVPSAGGADVSVTKFVDDSSPAEGETVTFTVTAANYGPEAATGVVVSDAIPSGLTLQSATASHGAYSTGTGDWTLASSLASGSSATLTLVTVVDAGSAGSTITNTAAVTASARADPVPRNDSDSTAIKVPTLPFVEVQRDGVGRRGRRRRTWRRRLGDGQPGRETPLRRR